MRVEFGFGVGFDADNRPLSAKHIQTATRQILIRASQLFGGCNLLEGQGAWVDPAGNLVLEASRILVVDIISGRFGGSEFGQDDDAKIRELARYIRVILNQAAVHVTKLVATSRNAFSVVD